MKTTQYTEMLVTVENVIVSESSNEETHPIRTVCEKNTGNELGLVMDT